jgi:transcriptional regulator GlxA family with amidase domain
MSVPNAKQMLETEMLSIEKVASLVGYDDPASFRRIFKRNAGQPPADYRKKFQRIWQIAQPLQTQ